MTTAVGAFVFWLNLTKRILARFSTGKKQKNALTAKKITRRRKIAKMRGLQKRSEHKNGGQTPAVPILSHERDQNLYDKFQDHQKLDSSFASPVRKRYRVGKRAARNPIDKINPIPYPITMRRSYSATPFHVRNKSDGANIGLFFYILSARGCQNLNSAKISPRVRPVVACKIAFVIRHQRPMVRQDGAHAEKEISPPIL